MTYLKELGTYVEGAAEAGGKFAEALVRTAGYALSGALAFVDKEMGYAAKAVKKRGEKAAGGAEKKPAK